MSVTARSTAGGVVWGGIVGSFEKMDASHAADALDVYRMFDDHGHGVGAGVAVDAGLGLGLLAAAAVDPAASPDASFANRRLSILDFFAEHPAGFAENVPVNLPENAPGYGVPCAAPASTFSVPLSWPSVGFVRTPESFRADRDRLSCFDGIESADVRLLTTAATVRKRPDIFTYVLPRDEMARVLAAQFAMPENFIRAGVPHVTSCTWSADWRSTMASIVEDKVVLLPCDGPEDADAEWVRANLPGHFVLMCTHDEGDMSTMECVSIGVVSGPPLLNTLDPATRVRGGRTDRFGTFVDANQLLLPVHVVYSPLASGRTIAQLLDDRGFPPGYVSFTAPPPVVHKALSGPLQVAVLDARSYWEDTVGEGCVSGMQHYLTLLTHSLLSEASVRRDIVDDHKRQLAAQACLCLSMPREADALLNNGLANRAWRKRIKKMNTYLTVYAQNLKDMRLYTDHDELTALNAMFMSH